MTRAPRGLTLRAVILAVALTAVALLLKWGLEPWAAQAQVPFGLAVSAVALAAWTGGVYAGLLATGFVAVLSAILFAEPRGNMRSIGSPSIVATAGFVIDGVAVSMIIGALQSRVSRTRLGRRAARDALRRERELSQSLRLEKAARSATEVRLRRLVDANVIAVFLTDRCGRFLDGNQAFFELVGRPRSSFEGGEFPCLDLIHPEDRARELECIAQIDRDGGSPPIEKRFLRPDGTSVWALCGGAALEDESRRLFFAADLSQQKRAEQELADAKDQAEEANRTKSAFLANISHELRTPMNAILGMAELALDEPLSPAVRGYLETVQDSGETLLCLLNDLLDFSRIELGRFQLDREVFSLTEVVDDVVRAMSLQTAEKGLELTCQIDPAVPASLWGDARRIRQVLVNLASNAVKFTEQGEINVAAGVFERDGENVVVELSVRDTGIGIAEDDRLRVFSAFTQADESLTRRHSGAGLGLAICRDLVDRMGGTIGVESRRGRGSRFWFRVPLTTQAASIGGPPAELLAPLHDQEVLVVDDNQTNLQMVAAQLSQWGVRATAASSADEALVALRGHAAAGRPFRAMLVDALMPKIDGFALIEAVRRENLPAGAAILMVSLGDLRTFADRCRDANISTFLEKPIGQAELLEVMLATLGGAAQPEARTAVAPEQQRQARRVLVVEDTPANQQVVKAMLLKAGHQVDLAVNGREAVNLLLDRDYDVVLMDIQMPTMDGYQATRAIRALDNPAKKRTPIIALTAHSMPQDRYRCLQAGMNAYLSKPLESEKLLWHVSHASPLSSSVAGDVTEAHDHHNPGVSMDQAADAPIYDRAETLRRIGNDEDLFTQMIEFFVEDAPPLLECLDAALDQGDIRGAERAAHSLKGLAANFSAQPAVAVAAQAEAFLREHNLAAARERASLVKEKIGELIRALQNEKRNGE